MTHVNFKLVIIVVSLRFDERTALEHNHSDWKYVGFRRIISDQLSFLMIQALENQRTEQNALPFAHFYYFLFIQSYLPIFWIKQTFFHQFEIIVFAY